MISAAARTAQSRPGTLLDRTPLRHLQPRAGVAVFEGEHLAVAHDLLAGEEDTADRGSPAA